MSTSLVMQGAFALIADDGTNKYMIPNVKMIKASIKQPLKEIEAQRANAGSEVIAQFLDKMQAEVECEAVDVTLGVLSLALGRQAVAAATTVVPGYFKQITVPATTPFTVTLPLTASAVGTIVVQKVATGGNLSTQTLAQATSGMEVAGTSYSTTTSVLTFAAGDAGAAYNVTWSVGKSLFRIGGQTDTGVGQLAISIVGLRQDGKYIIFRLPQAQVEVDTSFDSTGGDVWRAKLKFKGEKPAGWDLPWDLYVEA